MGVGQLWQIVNGQPTKILDGVTASFSKKDGLLAVYEQGNDIWLSGPALASSVNVTHSSDRIERMPQFWQSTLGQKIVFDGLSDGEAKRLYMSNLEGTQVEAISSAASYSPPGLDPTGQSIAFDENGSPMIYLIGSGTSPFLTQLYNYQPEAGTFFTSPSISPNGALLSWWVCKDSGSTRKCDLVLFTRAGDATYKVIHSYSASINMLETWLPNPIWSQDGQWIAFQTYSEVTPYDIWIMHPDGSESYRIGLALNPVWNPDSRHLAYTQRYPQTTSAAPTVNIIETRSFNMESTLLPFGSIPVAWFGH
jgi:Tol biopolymer transport system component